MINKELWDKCLENFSGASCGTLFVRTGIDDLNINSEKKKEIFKEFLVYGMNKNVIIEFDSKKNIPLFSGDKPEIVAERILSNWPKKTIIGSLDKDKDFFLYLILLDGFAQLFHGTKIGYVG